MSDTFAKLKTSILDSSVWQYSSDVRIVWITLLAMSDKTGFVETTAPGLANRARVSIEAAREAIRIFSSPDEDSSDPEFEGRRIAPVPRGWVLLNFKKHRARFSMADRRESKTEWEAAKRTALRESAERHAVSVHGPSTPLHSDLSLRSSSEISSASALCQADQDQINLTGSEERALGADASATAGGHDSASGTGAPVARHDPALGASAPQKPASGPVDAAEHAEPETMVTGVRALPDAVFDGYPAGYREEWIKREDALLSGAQQKQALGASASSEADPKPTLRPRLPADADKEAIATELKRWPVFADQDHWRLASALYTVVMNGKRLAWVLEAIKAAGAALDARMAGGEHLSRARIAETVGRYASNASAPRQERGGSAQPDRIPRQRDTGPSMWKHPPVTSCEDGIFWNTYEDGRRVRLELIGDKYVEVDSEGRPCNP